MTSHNSTMVLRQSILNKIKACLQSVNIGSVCLQRINFKIWFSSQRSSSIFFLLFGAQVKISFVIRVVNLNNLKINALYWKKKQSV